MEKISTNYQLAIKELGMKNWAKSIHHFENSFLKNEPLGEQSLLYLLALQNQHGQGEAQNISLLEEAIQRYPTVDKWHAALAEHYMAAGNYEKAVSQIEQALALNPANATAMVNRACWKSGRAGDGLESKRLFEEWGQRFMDPLTDAAAPLSVRNMAANKRLKVGYVSGDLKNHSVRYFIEAYFRHHDRQQFEIHAFMTLPGDEVTEWLKPLVDCWHDVAELCDSDLLTRIRATEIDVLVALSGHTHGDRLAVFAQRAAPVQVTWFGFMQTLGMRAMDWRLTDHAATPLATDDFYTERLYRLNCMVTYTPPLNADELYDSPYKTNGYVTMVCLNHSRKISDEALQVWARILNENPQAGLILISSEKASETSLLEFEARIKRQGLPLERVTVTGRLTMAAFMRMAMVADFALDSFPVSGGTTTLHALWMGLPTLTLDKTESGAIQGATAAIQRGCGLADAVAQDIDDYVSKAGDWIREPQKIDALRAHCRSGIKTSDLMAYEVRTRELEAAYRLMWKEYRVLSA